MIEVIDHAGELELRLTSRTLEGLYGEALRGLAGEVRSGDPGGPVERREVVVSSSGLDTLLADLLNEAVYLIDAEGFVAEGIEDARISGATLEAVLVGRTDARLRPLVKAATYHRLAVRRTGEGWEGRVVLDV